MARTTQNGIRKAIGIGLLSLAGIVSFSAPDANAGVYRLTRFAIKHATPVAKASAKVTAKTLRATGRAIEWLAY